MKKLTVALLFGGCSPEYEISLASVTSVVTQLDPLKYNIILVGITRDGQWYRYYGDLSRIAAGTWQRSHEKIPAILSPNRGQHGLIEIDGNVARFTQVDVVFPILHGENGEDGSIQGLLQLAGIPYVGCRVLASAVGMDKSVAHTLVAYSGIPVPKAITLYEAPNAQEAEGAVSSLRYPLYVKPARAGSSIGVSRVTQPDQLLKALALAFSYDEKVLVEEEVEGFEVGCAIIGNKQLIIGEVDELEVPQKFLDYQHKYGADHATVHLPARVSEETKRRIKETALKLYRVLGCSGYTRVDMFLTPKGEIYFNEVNTIPGFTETSRFPKMLMQVGYTYPQILDLLIAGARA